MYREFFGLKKSPFKITPDPALFYSGGKRGEILEALVYSIVSGSGITKVVGEVGSGKTMLCRMLENKLPKNIQIVYIANPSLSADNILQMIAFELGLTLVTASKLEAMQELHKWLLKQHAQARQVVVFIEEAQCMPIETLEEIRLLSNLETNEDKLLQIVLFGQPELDKNLQKPEIRQLKDRISNTFLLGDLKQEEIEGYLKHRMEKAGYRGPFIFSSRAVKLIGKYSKGLIRRVNILADKSLLAAFSDGQHIVKAKHVNLAGIDSQFKNKGSISKTGFTVFAVFFAALFSSALTYALINKNHQIKELFQAEYKVSPQSDQVAGKQNTATREVVAEKKKATPKGTPKQATATAQQVRLPAKRKTMEDYLLASEHWLINENPQYTIQLLLNKEAFKYSFAQYIQSLARFLDTSKLHIYKTEIKGQTMYGVLYGNFSSREEALAAKARLPRQVTGNGAFVRTVNSLKRKLTARLASSKT